MSRRIGRWTYNSESTHYGEAGWHLDGTPLVIDFMPGVTDCEPNRGMYLGYNWPGRDDGWMVATHLGEAMRVVEYDWDRFVSSTVDRFILSAVGSEDYDA